jgi:hypothetical protein
LASACKKRELHTTLDAKAQIQWTEAYNLIASTLDNIVGACTTLGYSNLTIDYIRLSDDIDSPRTYGIAGSLSFLIMQH